jgi:hypothetical protein
MCVFVVTWEHHLLLLGPSSKGMSTRLIQKASCQRMGGPCLMIEFPSPRFLVRDATPKTEAAINITQASMIYSLMVQGPTSHG